MNPKKHANTFMVNDCPDEIPRAHWTTLCGIVLSFGLALSISGWCQQKAAASPPSDPAVDVRILEVRRICFPESGRDILGAQMQEMVIAKLFESKRFSLTENCERADFVLKSSITERSEHVSRSESEGVSFGRHASESSVGTSSSASVSGSGHEALSSSETKEHAVVTLRLVDKTGDILWAVSIESAGGKIKGAIGDAAERAVRRLMRDIERAEKQVQKPQKPSQPE